MTHLTIRESGSFFHPSICKGWLTMLENERPAMLRQQHAGLSNNRLSGAIMPLILTTAENRSAQAAFEAYSELRKHEVGRPHLRENPHWQAIVAAAFVRFEREMEAAG